jgi:hypothetical protein
MTAEVKLGEGQKQLLSEFDLHWGIIGSQVLRQDGRTEGQGALGGGELAGGADDAKSTEVESVPGGGGVKVVVVDVPRAGDELGGPDIVPGEGA